MRTQGKKESQFLEAGREDALHKERELRLNRGLASRSSITCRVDMQSVLVGDAFRSSLRLRRVAKQMEAPEHIKLEWLKEAAYAPVDPVADRFELFFLVQLSLAQIGLAHARVTAGAQNLLQLDAMAGVSGSQHVPTNGSVQ